MQEIKLYKLYWKAIKIILLSTIFVIGGFWMITSSDGNQFIGWITICFFGLGYPVDIFHLFDRKPQIIINEIGIYDRMSNKNIINWEIIHNAYLADVHGQKFICLVIDGNYEPSKKKGKLYKKVSTINKSLGFQELNISLGQIKIDEVKLTDFINKMSQKKPNKKTTLTS